MFVIGTAGHIDHGKSALIHRLTGIDPDRLREEKERGMTIDLGFAWLKLPGGAEIGIVDVPGHEKFIKNMLAGVGSIDLALFVIAANESIMPQTREHLDILNLLEMKKGIVVITKTDLVDADTLSLVKLEIEDLVKGTFLQNAPVVPVSTVTGDGIDLLLNTVEKELGAAKPRIDLGRPRLFIDRVFTIVGAGTVVTGTLIDGNLSTGQEVEILPAGIKARIRGLQSHKTQLDRALPGSRVAVNLANISPEELHRGDVITIPKWLLPTDRFDVRLNLLSATGNPLKHGAIVSFFTGSAETLATIHLLDKNELEADESSVAQVTTVDKLALVKGDHFIIRSPMATLGGGMIIDPYAKRHKRFRTDIVDKIAEKETGALENVVFNFIEGTPLSRALDISIKCNLSPDSVAGALDMLKSDARIVVFGKEKDQGFMTAEAWNNIKIEAAGYVTEFHRNFPTRPGMPRGELASKLKLNASSPVLLRLFQDGLLVEEASTVRLPGFKIKFSPEQEKKAAEFLAQVAKNPYSPQVDIVLDKDLMNQLLEQKKVVRVSENVFFLPEVYEEMILKITGHIREKGKITAAEVRDKFNTSRKYAVALLEYMDERKITRRVGDDRVLR